MKKSNLFIPAIYLTFVALSFSCKNEGVSLVVENRLDTSRYDEPVVISKDDIPEGFAEGNEVPVVYDNEGDIVPFQLDDLDGDGQWDELFLLVNFDSTGTREYMIKPGSSGNLPDFDKRTNIRMGRTVKKGLKYEEVSIASRLPGTNTSATSDSFQFEGPGWENDKIAFRNYFDPRNGIDIFGKKVPYMVLDSVGVNTNYHEMQTWGMDILKVGNSLGAGAIALKVNDSIYRIAPGATGAFEVIAEGPLRSIFQLTFQDWNIGGKSLNIVHQISIIAGEPGYRSRVWVDNEPDNARLVTGIVNMHSDTVYKLSPNKEYNLMYTHAQQSFLEEFLGMGIILPADQFFAYGEAPGEGKGIVQTYYVELTRAGGDPYRFNFYSGWEKSNKEFASRENFKSYLQGKAKFLARPIKLKIEGTGID